ncbi:MAG TPA: hypothetical protein VF064_06095 [Pyrinomonadaceae bacterium]
MRHLLFVSATAEAAEAAFEQARARDEQVLRLAEGGADGALQGLDRRLAADGVNRVAHLGGALRARAERVPLGQHVIDEVAVMKGRARQIDRALPFEEVENLAEDFFERVDDDEAEAAREATAAAAIHGERLHVFGAELPPAHRGEAAHHASLKVALRQVVHDRHGDKRRKADEHRVGDDRPLAVDGGRRCVFHARSLTQRGKGRKGEKVERGKGEKEERLKG